MGRRGSERKESVGWEAGNKERVLGNSDQKRSDDIGEFDTQI
jgi:hypothetical protein